MTIIVAAIISAIIPAFVGVYLSRRVAEVHVLVNARLHEALDKITELELEIEGIRESAAETPHTRG